MPNMASLSTGMDEQLSEAEPECMDLTQDVCSGGFTNVQQFMETIHSDFMECVDPLDTLLVDELLSVGALSTDDVDKMSLLIHTRKERARLFWILLGYVDAKTFAQVCLPGLKKYYPHVVKDHKFAWIRDLPITIQCMYHEIRKRTTPARFADCLPSLGCCKLFEYKEITEGSQVGDASWNAVFNIYQRERDNTALREATAKFIHHILKATVPSDFQEIFNGGFPCTCVRLGDTETLQPSEKNDEEALPHQSSAMVHEFGPSKSQLKREMKREVASQFHCNRVDSQISFASMKSFLGSVDFHSPSMGLLLPWKPESKSSSSAYPNSTDEDYDSACSSSLCSEPTSENCPTGNAATDHQNSKFPTRSAKVRHASTVAKVNSALSCAASIRAVHRNLEEIEQLTSIMSETAADETLEFSSADRTKLATMKAKSTRLHNTQNTLYNKAATIWKEHKGLLVREFDSDVPLPKKSQLRKRLHLLENEMKEATGFLKKSQNSVKQITVYCNV